MIITKLQQFIIFDCDQSQITIPSSLSTKISKITKINPPTGSSLVTWSDVAPIQQLNLLDPNTIYLVTSKEGQLGYEFPGAVDAINYCTPNYSIPGLYTKKYIGNFEGNLNWFADATIDTFAEKIMINSDSSILNGEYYKINDRYLSLTSDNHYIKWNKEIKKYEFIIKHCKQCELTQNISSNIYDCSSCIIDYNSQIYDLDSDLDSDTLEDYSSIVETTYVLSEDLVAWYYSSGAISDMVGLILEQSKINYVEDLSSLDYKNNSVLMEGYFKPKFNGEYIFSIAGAGIAFFWIGEKIEYNIDNLFLNLTSNEQTIVESSPIRLLSNVKYLIKIQYFTTSNLEVKYELKDIGIQTFDEALGWEGTLENESSLENEDDESYDIERLLSDENEDEETDCSELEDYIDNEVDLELDNESCNPPKKKGILVINQSANLAACDCYETSGLDPSNIVLIATGLLADRLIRGARGWLVGGIGKLKAIISKGSSRSESVLDKLYKSYVDGKKLEKISKEGPIILREKDDIFFGSPSFPNRAYGAYSKERKLIVKEFNQLMEKKNQGTASYLELERIDQIETLFAQWLLESLKAAVKLKRLKEKEKVLENCSEQLAEKILGLNSKLEQKLDLLKKLDSPSGRTIVSSLSGAFATFISGQTVVTPVICNEIPSADNPGFGGASETATPELNRDTCECENCPQGFALGQGYYPFQGPETEGYPYCFKCDPELERCGIVANFDDPVNRTGGKCGCASGYELKPCINGCNVDGQYVKCASSLPPDCLNTLTCFNSKFEWDENLCDWSCKEDNCSSNQIQSTLNCGCLDCPPEAPIADKASNKCVCPVSSEDCLAGEIFEESLCQCISSSYGGFGQNGV